MTVYGYFDGAQKRILQDTSNFALQALKDALYTENTRDKDAHIRRACTHIQNIQMASDAIKKITQ